MADISVEPFRIISADSLHVDFREVEALQLGHIQTRKNHLALLVVCQNKSPAPIRANMIPSARKAESTDWLRVRDNAHSCKYDRIPVENQSNTDRNNE